MTDLAALKAAENVPPPDVFTEYSGQHIQDLWSKLLDGRPLGEVMQSLAIDIQNRHYHDWRLYALAIHASANIVAKSERAEAERLSLIARVERYEAALKKISERKTWSEEPWTHKRLADEYARMLEADRTTARAALGDQT